MDEIVLSISYQSLGEILDSVIENPADQSSPALLEQIQSAIAFHKDIQSEVNAVVAVNKVLRKRLADLEETNDLAVAGELSDSVVDRYKIIRDSGGDPILVYHVAKAEGVSEIVSIRILRTLFDLSLDEANAIIRQISIAG